MSVVAASMLIGVPLGAWIALSSFRAPSLEEAT
jgi:hypothetical protein